jgi:hypothetical protein
VIRRLAKLGAVLCLVSSGALMIAVLTTSGAVAAASEAGVAAVAARGAGVQLAYRNAPRRHGHTAAPAFTKDANPAAARQGAVAFLDCGAAVREGLPGCDDRPGREAIRAEMKAPPQVAWRVASDPQVGVRGVDCSAATVGIYTPVKSFRCVDDPYRDRPNRRAGGADAQP